MQDGLRFSVDIVSVERKVDACNGQDPFLFPAFQGDGFADEPVGRFRIFLYVPNMENSRTRLRGGQCGNKFLAFTGIRQTDDVQAAFRPDPVEGLDGIFYGSPISLSAVRYQLDRPVQSALFHSGGMLFDTQSDRAAPAQYFHVFLQGLRFFIQVLFRPVLIRRDFRIGCDGVQAVLQGIGR